MNTFTHDGHEYRFEATQCRPLTYMGWLILPESLTPIGLVMLLENSMGDVYRIRATHHADKGTFEFYHVTGQYLGAWVKYEPEYAEPESENARAYERKAWRYSDRA